jgi:hypothetical protein
MDRNPGTTRRNLLRAGLGVALAATAAPQARSKVVIARDAGNAIDSARLLQLLDRAVQAVSDANSPLEAWKKIVKPGEVVGLKVNCLAGRGASTSVVLVDAVCERLQQAGIRAGDIVVWDRLNSDLESAGFRPSSRAGRIRYI